MIETTQQSGERCHQFLFEQRDQLVGLAPRQPGRAEVAQHGMAVEDEGRVLRWRWGGPRSLEGRGDDVAA